MNTEAGDTDFSVAASSSLTTGHRARGRPGAGGRALRVSELTQCDSIITHHNYQRAVIVCLAETRRKEGAQSTGTSVAWHGSTKPFCPLDNLRG